ncbi:phosphate propanoyltransferase [Patescibacteria group bacterium]|nr:phosphate propanoyltransferase [Patescibacteria group bacterium]
MINKKMSASGGYVSGVKKIKIEVSAHHAHLSRKDLDILFGKNYQLKPIKALSQTGQFASKETIKIKTKDGQIDDVRILGPTRPNTQVELSRTECFELKIDPPVLECTCPDKKGGCAQVEIVGPKGKVKRCAAILAHRHIHCDPSSAKKMGLKNKQLVSVKTNGKRSITFHNILVRTRKDFVCRMHLDTDEANAAGIKQGDFGQII